MKKIMKEKIYIMLEDELKNRKRKLNHNKFEIARLAREQKALKKEWCEINQLIWELKSK